MNNLARVLALMLLAAPVQATAEPDARIRSMLYTPDKVVRFTARPGYQSSIRFGPDERIENVAVGDSAAWQVTPNKRGDYLFIKPLVAGARSNLMVVTDRRTYLFDLEAPRAGRPTYALSFRYPDFPAPGSVEPAPQLVAPAAVALASAAPPLPVVRNFGWQARGAKSLRPTRVYDDSKAVYLGWPETSALPAILLPAPDKTESPVNYKVENGYIVVDGLPQQIIIRRGREQATVTASRRKAPTMKTAQTENRP